METSSKMIIFHIDVNSAFLSWSAVKNLLNGSDMDLRTVPSVIGGDATKRHGIVLAKSIMTKPYGIVTAEPIAQAMRKCPGLIIEKPDFDFYRMQSSNLMKHISSFCPDIEQVSIDECYMDFTPISHLYESPVVAANIIRASIKEQFGFTVNIGISDKKVLAKMASDFEKPDKVHTLFTSEIKEKMWPLPVGDLLFCGKSTIKALYKLGIRTIGELANANEEILATNLKSHGLMLKDYANGIDESVVNTVHEKAKGIGNSTTGSEDILTREGALKLLGQLTDSVCARLRDDGRNAGIVTVEIKYTDFTSQSKQTTLDTPTNLYKDIYSNAINLFDMLWNHEPIRLLGVRIGKLCDPDEPSQITMFDYLDSIGDNSKSMNSKEKLQKLDIALDSIRKKYGDNAIMRASNKKN